MVCLQSIEYSTYNQMMRLIRDPLVTMEISQAILINEKLKSYGNNFK